MQQNNLEFWIDANLSAAMEKEIIYKSLKEVIRIFSETDSLIEITIKK